MTTNKDQLSNHHREYLGAVREHLTLHGVPPERVGEYLEEMAAHIVESGTDPVAEFGTPNDYAAGIASIEGTPPWLPWVRGLGAYLTTVSIMAAINWIGHGTAPGQLPLREFRDILPLGVIGAAGALLPGARLRDRMRGVDGGDGQGSGSVVLRYFGALLATCATLALVATAFFNDQVVGLAALPAWAMGLGCLMVAAVVGWWSVIKPSRSPVFPHGSRMKSSMWRRPIQVD